MQLGPMRVMPYSSGDLDDLPLERRALGAGLGEAGGEHHGGPHSPAAALFEHALHLRPPDREQREVGRLGQVGQTRVGLHAEEHAAARVHRVDACRCSRRRGCCAGPSRPTCGCRPRRRRWPPSRGAKHGPQVGLEGARPARAAAPAGARITRASAATGRSPVDEERVDVDLGHLREVDGDARQRLDDHAASCARSTAGAPRNGPSSFLARMRSGSSAMSRSLKGDDSERDIAQHLGQHAAEAERHHGSEDRVPLEPDEQLPVAVQHLLDEDAFEGVAGPLGDAAGRSRPRRRRRRPGRASCTSPPSVLWWMLAPTAFMASRPPMRRGRGQRLRLSRRQGAGRHRHAVGGQQLLGAPLVERAAQRRPPTRVALTERAAAAAPPRRGIGAHAVASTALAARALPSRRRRPHHQVVPCARRRSSARASATESRGGNSGSSAKTGCFSAPGMPAARMAAAR